MIINRSNLNVLFTSYNAAFNRGLQAAPSSWMTIATQVPSSTAENTYAWLGKIPGMREWIGDRQVQNLSQSDYSIKNKPWEQTIGVNRDHIEDDQYGVYAPMFEFMGDSAGTFPDELIWPLFKNGTANLCYDGQNFFDTDHPVLDASGAPQSVSNDLGGGGTPWYLIDDTRPLKPMLYQTRRALKFTRKDRDTDDNVFDRNEYVYGADLRANAGYGFWQFAQRSAQTLDAAGYKAARQAMLTRKQDYGKPLVVRPSKLIVPTSLLDAAEEVLKKERDAAGASNTLYKTAEIVHVPWLD